MIPEPCPQTCTATLSHLYFPEIPPWLHVYYKAAPEHDQRLKVSELPCLFPVWHNLLYKSSSATVLLPSFFTVGSVSATGFGKFWCHAAQVIQAGTWANCYGLWTLPSCFSLGDGTTQTCWPGPCHLLPSKCWALALKCSSCCATSTDSILLLLTLCIFIILSICCWVIFLFLGLLWNHVKL